MAPCTSLMIARYRASFPNNYRFTAHAFDPGLTLRNNLEALLPVGHRMIDLAAVSEAPSTVMIVDRQHFSGLTT